MNKGGLTLKKVRQLALLVLCLYFMSLTLVGCNSGSGNEATDNDNQEQTQDSTEQQNAGGEQRTFTLAVWGGNNPKVLDKYLVPRFEAETGAKFQYDTGSTTDRLTKLYTEKGNPSIDVAIVPIDSVPKLLADDVILPTDTSIPNYSKLIPEAQIPGGYGVSVQVVAVGYSPDRVPKAPESWMDLWDDAYKNRLALGAIPGANGVAFLAMINRLEGGDETDLSKGINKIKELKPIRAFYDESGQIPPMIENNEIDAFTMLSGLTASFKAAGAPFDIVIPKEGSPLTMNVAVIPKGTKNLDLAKKAVEILMSEELQLGYAEILYYAPTNTEVELPPNLQEIIHPRKGDKLIQLDWAALEEHNEEMLEMWNKEIVSN
jgi:putative spermidine/putrescine transport system substrate-binding protein